MKPKTKKQSKKKVVKFTPEKAKALYRALKSGKEPQTKIAKKFGVQQPFCSDVLNGRRWGKVTGAGKYRPTQAKDGYNKERRAEAAKKAKSATKASTKVKGKKKSTTKRVVTRKPKVKSQAKKSAPRPRAKVKKTAKRSTPKPKAKKAAKRSAPRPKAKVDKPSVFEDEPPAQAAGGGVLP